MNIINSEIPEGELSKKWSNYKDNIKPINPANKKKYKIIIVGTGLAGASAAASLAELGFNVNVFSYHDSPRRAHSIAAQGGINAAKNYKNDGDSVHRLFYDTIKGGDFRSREANVYRLAEISVKIIDHCVAQGVPFAREYSGLLDNRSFGGSLVSRTFYAKGQTGQQLLIGAYGALSRQINLGNIKLYSRYEMQDIIIQNNHVKGIITRNLLNGEIESFGADAVILATGGYSCVFYLSTNAINCNASAIFKSYKKGAYFANPCFTQIHPTCIPISGDHQSKLTLMSESLRNDGRVWVSKSKNDKRSPENIQEFERDYYLEKRYPSYGNLAPRDISSRAAKLVCDQGYGVGDNAQGVYLDFKDTINKKGKNYIESKYGNLFHMYQKITGEDPYKQPMRIYPAPHYTMGGLWVDYELKSNLNGLFVLGEANFSDHGANRLGASALMQGLADGYFIIPYTISNYLNKCGSNSYNISGKEFKDSINIVEDYINKIKSVNGKKSPEYFHKKLGNLMWNNCGMSRTEQSLKNALSLIPEIKNEFWKEVKVPGSIKELNQTLEKAIRVSSFIELAELICYDALERKESCGGHFREEYKTDDSEAKRDDINYCHISAWKYKEENQKPILFKEQLNFENIKLTERSYK